MAVPKNLNSIKEMIATQFPYLSEIWLSTRDWAILWNLAPGSYARDAKGPYIEINGVKIRGGQSILDLRNQTIFD